jgi:uncharacterized membrane protein YbhN (UPF0104 family)
LTNPERKATIPAKLTLFAGGLEPALVVGRRLWDAPARKVIVAIAALAAAAWLIRNELRGWTWALFVQALRATPWQALAAAAALTPLSYVCLAITEWYSLQSLGHRQSWRRAGAVAFISYAVSNSLGFSWATGTAARLRLYTGWGLSPAEVAAVALVAGTAVSLSGVVSTGLGLLASPRLFAEAFHSPRWVIAGLGIVLLAPGILWFTVLRGPRNRGQPHAKRPLGAFSRTGRAFALAAGIGDWVLSGAALYVLLPNPTPAAFPSFLAVFVLGSLVSAATGVPGGVGVFEAVVIGLTTVLARAHETATALILYRAIYSLGPLTATGLGLVGIRMTRPARRRRSTGA